MIESLSHRNPEENRSWRRDRVVPLEAECSVPFQDVTALQSVLSTLGISCDRAFVSDLNSRLYEEVVPEFVNDPLELPYQTLVRFSNHIRPHAEGCEREHSVELTWPKTDEDEGVQARKAYSVFLSYCQDGSISVVLVFNEEANTLGVALEYRWEMLDKLTGLLDRTTLPANFVEQYDAENPQGVFECKTKSLRVELMPVGDGDVIEVQQTYAEDFDSLELESYECIGAATEPVNYRQDYFTVEVKNPQPDNLVAVLNILKIQGGVNFIRELLVSVGNGIAITGSNTDIFEEREFQDIRIVSSGLRDERGIIDSFGATLEILSQYGLLSLQVSRLLDDVGVKVRLSLPFPLESADELNWEGLTAILRGEDDGNFPSES